MIPQNNPKKQSIINSVVMRRSLGPTVKLVAIGKGTTVVPSIPLETVDFGNQFTTTKPL